MHPRKRAHPPDLLTHARHLTFPQRRQVPLVTNDLVNATLVVCAEAIKTRAGLDSEERARRSLEQTGLTALVGDAYYAVKRRLLLDEQIVLRLLRFALVAPQPHKRALAYAAAARLPPAATALALASLNDGIVGAPLLLDHSEGALAAAAAALALRLAAPDDSLEADRLHPDASQVAEAVAALSDALIRCAAAQTAWTDAEQAAS